MRPRVVVGSRQVQVRHARRVWNLPARPGVTEVASVGAIRRQAELARGGGDSDVRLDDLAAAVAGPEVADQWLDAMDRDQLKHVLRKIITAWGMSWR